jgi:NtrC-family two-component system sensor histidine kinase KinB
MLRARLFRNLLPFVVILLAMGIFAIALFSQLADSVDTAVTESYRNIQTTYVMAGALEGMNRKLQNTPTSQADPQSFSGYQKIFEQNLASQLENASFPGERELSEQLAASYAAFYATATKVSTQPVRSPRDQRKEPTFTSDVDKINDLLAKIRGLDYKAVLETTRNLEKKTHDITRLLTIGMIVVLFMSAYTCYQLSRSILQPILSLTRATREVSEGRLKQSVPVVSRDEIGQLAASFNKMATQLEEYRQSTSEEIVRLHRTMETTLASFPDPIFVLNREGAIELKNPAAAELAASHQWNGHLPERLHTVADKALNSGENFLPHSFNEAVCYRVRGAEKFFLPRILVMRNKENELFGVAVVLYDVTRFRLLDAAKTNLVATVSHELKTPLTSVRMALHLLLEKTVGVLNPKQDELLQTARNDSERLLRILNDLLDLARLDEGDEQLRKEKVTPAELLQAVIDETADKVASRGLKMNCEVDPNLPTVLVDRQRINHVFTNLVLNAIKHSPPGGDIFLQATRAEEGGIQFNVTDQGQGVPEEYQVRIFDRFFRVPGQSKTGAGLGLSIAREITVAHGGRIGVKSTPGHGSSFFVILKAAETSGTSFYGKEMNGRHGAAVSNPARIG